VIVTDVTPVGTVQLWEVPMHEKSAELAAAAGIAPVWKDTAAAPSASTIPGRITETL
jgi:hypothetical protein